MKIKGKRLSQKNGCVKKEKPWLLYAYSISLSLIAEHQKSNTNIYYDSTQDAGFSGLDPFAFICQYFFQIYVRVIKIGTDCASSVSSLYVINRIHLLLCLFLLKPNLSKVIIRLLNFFFVFVFEFLQVKINRSINMTYKYIDTIVDFFVRNEGKSQQINSMLFKLIVFLYVLSSAAHVESRQQTAVKRTSINRMRFLYFIQRDQQF